MLSNLRLLRQLRGSTDHIRASGNIAELKAVLDAMDVVTNELMLRESPDFYVEHLRQGATLLADGQALAKSHRAVLPNASLDAREAETAPAYDSLQRDIDALHRLLLPVVEALDESRSAEEKAFLERMTGWEHSLYEHRLQRVPPFAEPQLITRDRLEHYLQQKFPAWKGLRVTQFMSLDGGFSKKTILFETDDTVNGKQSLVIRAEQAANLLGYDGSDVTQEYHMIALMREMGLPIAEPLWLEADPTPLGVRFIVSRKAHGRTYGGNFGSEEPLSPDLLLAMIRTFIAMHNIRIDPNHPTAQKSHLREWLHCRTAGEATRYLVTTFLRNSISRCDVRLTPQMLRALKWLERNIPDCDEPPAVVHIDFAFNNLIINGNEITAVLDWESSRLGDPAEDVIWTQQTLAPHISMEEFLKLYEAGTGRSISQFRIAYARVSKCLLNAISMFSALRIIEKQDAFNIKLAPLGLTYMALLGSNFNQLIQEAEQARGS